MEAYIKYPEIRWSDIDPNVHLKHSVYYDFGAYSRLSYLFEHGLTPEVLRQMNIGPILLREEARFKREVVMGDQLAIDLQLVRSRKDFSRWTMRHQLIKNKEIIAAIITVDGAWIDTQLRKLAVPQEQIVAAFNEIPRSSDFEWDGPAA